MSPEAGPVGPPGGADRLLFAPSWRQQRSIERPSSYFPNSFGRGILRSTFARTSLVCAERRWGKDDYDAKATSGGPRYPKRVARTGPKEPWIKPRAVRRRPAVH